MNKLLPVIKDIILDIKSIFKNASWFLKFFYLFLIIYLFPLAVLIFCMGSAFAIASYILDKLKIPDERELLSTVIAIFIFIPLFIFILQPVMDFWSNEIWHSGYDGGDDGYRGYGPARSE